jgi:hypothetical protein
VKKNKKKAGVRKDLVLVVLLGEVGQLVEEPFHLL